MIQGSNNSTLFKKKNELGDVAFLSLRNGFLLVGLSIKL